MEGSCWTIDVMYVSPFAVLLMVIISESISASGLIVHGSYHCFALVLHQLSDLFCAEKGAINLFFFFF